MYNLVKEANKTEELGPEDVVKEAHMDAVSSRHGKTLTQNL